MPKKQVQVATAALVGDLYQPRNASGISKRPLSFAATFKPVMGSIYAQTMAEQGFVTLAF